MARKRAVRSILSDNVRNFMELRMNCSKDSRKLITIRSRTFNKKTEQMDYWHNNPPPISHIKRKHIKRTPRSS